MELVFATQNINKLKEVQELMPEGIKLRSLADLGHTAELEDTSSTLEGNAKQKAEFIARTYGVNCFADDTGLEIEALNGAPGVYSARYAGLGKQAKDNMQRVLSELEGVENRAAQFRTSICLILKGKVHTFDGVAKGRILLEETGDEGFGYDPIFAPEDDRRSYAEMSRAEKNENSHRGRAIRALTSWLAENAV